MKYYLYLIVILTTQSGCKSNAPKYESKYQAAYEYINNCENLTFWKEDICDEKYKDMFPINIIPDIFPDGKDASGFKPLINYIFNRNEKSDWYVVFTKQVNNSIQAYCFQCNRMFFPQISYLISPESGLPICDFSFIFIFNDDNSIKSVSKFANDGNNEFKDYHSYEFIWVHNK